MNNPNYKLKKEYLVKKEIKLIVNQGVVLQGSVDGLWIIDTLTGFESKISEDQKRRLVEKGFLEEVN